MTTNISNFEATKPKKTYKAILAAKKYFKKRVKDLSPAMTSDDGASKREAEKALELLSVIEDHFLRGE